MKIRIVIFFFDTQMSPSPFSIAHILINANPFRSGHFYSEHISSIWIWIITIKSFLYRTVCGTRNAELNVLHVKQLRLLKIDTFISLILWQKPYKNYENDLKIWSNPSSNPLTFRFWIHRLGVWKCELMCDSRDALILQQLGYWYFNS